MKLLKPFWLPALVVCVVGFGVSYWQPWHAVGRDIRIEATRSIYEQNKTYMGDPMPSIVVARHLEKDPRAKIYAADLSMGSAFIYPPIGARLYEPLANLSPRVAHQRLAVATHVLFFAICLLFARLLFAGGSFGWEELAIGIVALGVFYPLHHAVELNQAMVFVTLIVGTSILALEKGRDLLAGFAFAIAFAVKPQLVLVLPILWMHAAKMAKAAIVSSVLLLALSLAYAGLPNHVDYATRVLPTLSRGYAYYANQSFDGLFNRLFVDQTIGVLALPPASIAVRVCTIVCGIGAYGAAVWLAWKTRKTKGLATWIFALAWLVTTLVSPISWQHHYAPAIFVFALLYRAISAEPALRTPRFAAAAAIAFTLMAAYFEVRALHSPASRLLASYLFVGALVLAGVLARVIVVKAKA